MTSHSQTLAVVIASVTLGTALVVALVAWVVGPQAPTGTAVASTADAGELADAPSGYALWATTQRGAPVRWDPCTPIRWVLDPDGAPPGAQRDITMALDRIGEVTGLEFAFAGTTDEAPSRDRAPYQPARYGDDAWAPVLVAWRQADTSGLPLSDSDRGVAVPVAVTSETTKQFVTGQIVFNSDRHLQPGFDDRGQSWGATILHEVGHLVGLDHVDDPTQLMFPFPGHGPTQLGDGDRAGLRAVGDAAGCLDKPAPARVEVDYVDDFG